MSGLDSVDYHQPHLAEELLRDLEARKNTVLSNVIAFLRNNTIQDSTDRQLVADAAAFIEKPTESLADTVKHATNLGQVLAGYMQKGEEGPAEIDALHEYLLKLQCINRINFVEQEMANGSSYSPAIKESMLLTFDTATVLSRGYNDFAMLRGLLDLHREVVQL